MPAHSKPNGKYTHSSARIDAQPKASVRPLRPTTRSPINRSPNVRPDVVHAAAKYTMCTTVANANARANPGVGRVNSRPCQSSFTPAQAM